MQKNYFQILDLDIEFLGLRSYLYQILKNNFIHKIGDLVSLKFSDILELDDINERSSSEIMNKVHSFGLFFLDEPNNQKNKEQIKAGIKTYNLRKKYYILNFQNRQIEVLHISIEVLDLLPFEYGVLKSLKIYTLIDLIKMDRKTIESKFNRVYRYKSSNSMNEVFVSYNKIINEIHLLGLTFSDEKVECTSRIFAGEHFR
jgi:DNA-directed RNA polymerase alpha subunit